MEERFSKWLIYVVSGVWCLLNEFGAFAHPPAPLSGHWGGGTDGDNFLGDIFTFFCVGCAKFCVLEIRVKCLIYLFVVGAVSSRAPGLPMGGGAGGTGREPKKWFRGNGNLFFLFNLRYSVCFHFQFKSSFSRFPRFCENYSGKAP